MVYLKYWIHNSSLIISTLSTALNEQLRSAQLGAKFHLSCAKFAKAPYLTDQLDKLCLQRNQDEQTHW